MSAAERNAGLTRIRTAMIEKKMTQAELADAADCHEKTIQNLMNGRQVRDQTLFDVCMVLGLEFDEVKAAWSGQPMREEVAQSPQAAAAAGASAPIELGAYTRTAVDDYIGTYLTIRPSFSEPGGVVAYRTDITWDDTKPALAFEEHKRFDAVFAHRGYLYVPASASFVHLVSLTKGAMRMVMVSQIDTRIGRMRGLITTLHKHSAQLVPVSTPIVYVKQADFDGVAFGEIAPDTPSHAALKALLEEATRDGYARLISG